MKIAFLILNHRAPSQLVRLLDTLRSQLPDSPIVVHHDASHGKIPEALIEPIDNVHLLMSGRPITWGDFSLVDAYCWSLKWMREHLEFDWVVLLSGQDYPIKPLSDLGDNLSAGGSDAVFRGTPIGKMPISKRMLMHRRYHFQYRSAITIRFRWLPRGARGFLRKSAWALMPVFNNLQPILKIYRLPGRVSYRIGLRAAHFPFNDKWPCWHGSLWFALSRRALEYVLGYMSDHPEYVRYCSRTLIPDESMLATILFNSTNLNISNRDVTYTRWPNSRASHPHVFQLDDFNELTSVPQYFARKFDVDRDTDILDALDDFIGHNSSSINRS